MSAEIAFCRPDEDVETARAIMQQGGHDRLLVIAGKGQLCGLLSAEDIGQGGTQTAAPGHVVKTAGRAKGGWPHHPDTFSVKPRSEDGRVGKEWFSTSRSRCVPFQ